MRKSIRRKSLLGTAIAALALTGFSTAAAQATTATWTPNGTTQWSAPIKFTLSSSTGGSAYCFIQGTDTTTWSGTVNGFEGGSPGFYWLTGGAGKSWAHCNGSETANFNLGVVGGATVEGGVYHVSLEGNPETARPSPFGTYYQSGKLDGIYKNGSGTTMSTVTFTNQKLGWLYPSGATLSISGTFRVTTGSGGLLTLV